jgi:hypothetical protein
MDRKNTLKTTMLSLFLYFSMFLHSITVTDIVEFQSASGNLIENGSFELGLGASPFYPGWYINEQAAPAALAGDAIPLPVLDTSQVHNGKKSLLMQVDKSGKYYLTVDIKQPLMEDDADYTLSFWARSDSAVELLDASEAGQSGNGTAGKQWKQFTMTTMHPQKFPVKIKARSKTMSPYKLWIDDIMWNKGTKPVSQKYINTSPVEIVLIPANRNGIHLYGKPYQYTIRIKGRYSSELSYMAIIRDLTRHGKTVKTFSLKLSAPSGSVQSFKHNLPVLKRGHYQLLVAAIDKKNKKIIGVGRDRFSVLSDISKAAHFKDFIVGTHGGLRL